MNSNENKLYFYIIFKCFQSTNVYIDTDSVHYTFVQIYMDIND